MRDYAIDLFKDLQEEFPSFKTQVTLSDNTEQVGETIRKSLHVNLDEQFSWGDGAPAYRAWRERISAFGILVFQFESIPETEALGFSLTERPLPVIGITTKISENGRTFTMLHEFVHILLNESAVCDLDERSPRARQEIQIEAFCNASAAAALMPQAAFLSNEIVSSRGARSEQWTDQEIAAGAKTFGVSRHAFVRRLLTFDKTTAEFYGAKDTQYRRENAANRARKKEKQTGPIMRPAAAKAIHNLDRHFISAVLRGYHSKLMTLVDAADLLAVRPEKVRDVEARLVAASS